MSGSAHVLFQQVPAPKLFKSAAEPSEEIQATGAEVASVPAETAAAEADAAAIDMAAKVASVPVTA